MVTNWSEATSFERARPCTYRAVQDLFLAMARCERARGDLLGRWSRKPRYEFERALANTVIALAAEGDVTPAMRPARVRLRLLEQITAFGLAFPNWPDAEQFASRFFMSDEADRLIAAILKL